MNTRRKLGAGLLAVGVAATMLMATVAFADHGILTEQGNCPVDGKVEANGGNQDEINDLVLAAGTHVCIKAGNNDGILVTADGETTLQEYLFDAGIEAGNSGQGRDVSHYTIIPPTTTTTVQDTTTTTVQDTTTTTTVDEEVRYDCEDGKVVENPDGEYATEEEAAADSGCTTTDTTPPVPPLDEPPTVEVICGMVTVKGLADDEQIRFQIEAQEADLLDNGVFTFTGENGDNWEAHLGEELIAEGTLDDCVVTTTPTTTPGKTVTTTPPATTPPATLPFTGPGDYVLPGLGLATLLLAAGGWAIRLSRGTA